MKKKIDSRIRTLVENGVELNQRSVFVVVGDNGRNQVMNLHYMLSKASVRARPSVLWCYKKELGFTSHRKKRMKELKRKIKHGLIDPNKDDPFELFVSSTEIRYCYYAETHKVLGNTFGMCVLQDFEAMTPNLLARTIETVEGGGIIVILLRSLKSVKQFSSIVMDVHARYQTDSHKNVVGRFNGRFIQSLRDLQNCILVDDTLDVLPWARQTLLIEAVPHRTAEEKKMANSDLRDLQASLADTQPAGAIVSRTKTVDQAKAILTFIEAISEKTLRSTVTLTAARGRGKSAALGLAVAAAVGYGYSNIFVTSPSPENLKTLFEFVFKGFDAIGLEEHNDYELVESTNPEFRKAIVRVNIFGRDHRQTIQYIQPHHAAKLGQAELVVIDEAAAIPLPLVRELMGPYLVFLASTVNGYEGTGRSLSLKLIEQLRKQSSTLGVKALPGLTDQTSFSTTAVSASGVRKLREVTLDTPIRYAHGDPIEAWLNSLLCLDATVVPRLNSGCPHPSKCDLYFVNRDTLFSYNPTSEQFLQRLMSLYVASHYKNQPNDLQLLSDAPAHQIYCLLGPVDPTSNDLPEVLCVLQVCLEGDLSSTAIEKGLTSGNRANGDLVPWTVSQQFQDSNFASLTGARVVRVATHPEYQRMGYGHRSLELLSKYFSGQMPCIEDATSASEDSKKAHLLSKLTERPAERLDYLSVAFGVTTGLFNFWKRGGYIPVYVRQTPNELTGEHSCIMIKVISDGKAHTDWLVRYWEDFQRRFIVLLGYQFRTMPTVLCLGILERWIDEKTTSSLTSDNSALDAQELDRYFSEFDVKRVNSYAKNMVDYHVIVDLLPMLARLWFLKKIDVSLTAVQKAILLGIGLQHRQFDDIAVELSVETRQLMGLFSSMFRKFAKYLVGLREKIVASSLPEDNRSSKILQPTATSLEEDENSASAEARKLLADTTEFDSYKIDIDDDELIKATAGKKSINTISLKAKKSQTKKGMKPKKKLSGSGESSSKKRRKKSMKD